MKLCTNPFSISYSNSSSSKAPTSPYSPNTQHSFSPWQCSEHDDYETHAADPPSDSSSRPADRNESSSQYPQTWQPPHDSSSDGSGCASACCTQTHPHASIENPSPFIKKNPTYILQTASAFRYPQRQPLVVRQPTHHRLLRGKPVQKRSWQIL